MRREDIRDLTRAMPFQPFRVFLTTGETFDIQHPDMIMATLGTAHIAVWLVLMAGAAYAIFAVAWSARKY